METFRQIFISCEFKFIKELQLDKHIQNPSSRESALSLIHEYVTVNPSIAPARILESYENECQYERWCKQRQKSYQNGSTSPAFRGTQRGTIGLKKQSSFLIENAKKTKSFVDLNDTDSR